MVAALILGSPGDARNGLARALGVTLPQWPIAGAAAGMVVAFVVLDLLNYGVHRLEHAVAWLWRVHALHHSDPDVDVTTSVRHHPFEYLLAATAYWVAALVLAIPPGAVVTYGVTLFAAAAVQHGNIRLPARLERWLRPLLITADLHRVHHSIERHGQNANYGAVLSLWDRLFGTLVSLTPAKHEAIVFGVGELAPRQCLKPAAMLLTPWRLARATRATAAEAIR